MSDGLIKRFELVERAMQIGAPLSDLIQCWRSIAELALEENDEEVFDTSARIVTSLEKL